MRNIVLAGAHRRVPGERRRRATAPLPRDGLRRRTAGTDGASRSRYRAVGRGGTRSGDAPAPRLCALPAVEANPQAGGTVRPNTSARLAGGGPPMAGHVCQSVSGKKSEEEPAFGPGCSQTGCPGRPPRGSGTCPDVARGRCLEACVFKNWVSEIVRRVTWRNGVKWRALLEGSLPGPSGRVASNGSENLEKFSKCRKNQLLDRGVAQ